VELQVQYVEAVSKLSVEEMEHAMMRKIAHLSETLEAIKRENHILNHFHRLEEENYRSVALVREEIERNQRTPPLISLELLYLVWTLLQNTYAMAAISSFAIFFRLFVGFVCEECSKDYTVAKYFLKMCEEADWVLGHLQIVTSFSALMVMSSCVVLGSLFIFAVSFGFTMELKTPTCLTSGKKTP
jgi:hypothetical protein